MRSPECGSPETSSTRSLSRTPSMATTARLFTGVNSRSSGEASISTMLAPACLMSTSTLAAWPLDSVRSLMTSPSRRTVTLARSPEDALVVEAVGDGLALPDDAEARRGGDGDAAVALVLLPGDQCVHRRLEAERGGARGNVVDAAVGDQERAGDAVDRHVRQGRGQRAEQFRAVGLAVGLSGLDDADFEALDLLQAVDQRFLRLCGLAVAVAKVLARALVDDDGRDRGEGIAVLAREGRIGERQQEQRERGHAHRGAACARHQQHNGDDDDRGQREPQHERGNERRECDAVVHEMDPSMSFRGDAKHRTRNLEIPGSALRAAPE